MKKSFQPLRFAIIAADSILLAFNNGVLEVLLMKIHRPPYFINQWGLPGGLVSPKETAEDAARRHLLEKGGIKRGYYLEQLCTFSRVDRDPRGRVVSVAYLGLCDKNRIQFSKDIFPYEVRWFPVKKIPSLAYDHNEIIRVALERLRAKLEYTNIAMALLPDKFTLSELQTFYEDVLGRKFDKRNFRKKFLLLNLLGKTREKRRGASRPAKLYRFRAHVLKTVKIM